MFAHGGQRGQRGWRGRLADAQLDTEQRADLSMGFDTLDMRWDVDFFLAGEVWLKRRAGGGRSAGRGGKLKQPP